ncbi:putative receptor-type tyrosine-protein phosphatase mosPTP-1 isoform X3 [Dermacentor variabilis]|uniref:putative receptor-type tyrosine-protein phosphatase mosPTP-1 isoform X3 n=1 Tax=Dermacentor variabilis TaxID=34621 RepID=UPI003F5ADFB7
MRWCLVVRSGRGCVSCKGRRDFLDMLLELMLLSLERSIKSVAVLAALGYFNQKGDGEAEKIFVRVGANVTFRCPDLPQSGQQPRHLTWWKEDRRLIEATRERVTVAPEAGARVALMPGSSALLFRSVVAEDSGEYQCVVNNRQGRRGIVRLYVQDVPDPPGIPIVVGFTSRSVNLSWTSSVNTHNSPILQYIIHIRIGEKGDWDTRNKVMTSDNSTNFQVIGLKPFTVYSFRVLAVNAIGASKPSKESFYMVTLREVPEGKPTIVHAQNTSSSTIRIQWTAPPRHTIHGEFEGYRITYRPRDKPQEESREIVVRDSKQTQYTIRNLDTFTQYLVSLQVFNPAGRGPAVVVPVMTDEGVPSPPVNVTAVGVTDNTVRLKWREPEKPNGVLQGYYVYFQPSRNGSAQQQRRTVSHPQPIQEYALTNLRPFSYYDIWVNAFTQKHIGESSNLLKIQTDVQGPSAPTIVNLTCQSLDSLFLQWERPQTYYNKVDYYFVHYRSEEAWGFEEIAMAATDRLDHVMFIPNLTANTLYEVKVQGATRSIIDQTTVFKGQFSDSRKVLLQTFNDGAYSDPSLSAAVVAGVVCVSFALFLAIISFVLWKKYFQAAYYYLDDPPGNRASPQLSETFDDSEYASVHVSQWAKHVADLHADGDIGFSREYESLQQATDLDLSSDYSQMAENKGKNRYVNIVAYDHTRVILKPTPGQKKSADYINANYIDGYNKPRAYIGTQGPLPSTFDDYWRMIWEQRVCIIIMITNLVERGRRARSVSAELDDLRKCDMYWPKEGTETYGIIQVKLVQEVVMATYTVRTFAIKNIKVKKKQASERTVYQYHYTNWPDHGVPDHPLPVLSFVAKSSAANPPTAGPMIVHCSAGVGRTGTYIVLDAMLKQMRHRQSVNVYGFLRHIRQQRNYLVQTEEQYVFIHDALLEAIESGDTEAGVSQLSRYVQSLQTAQVGNTGSGDNIDKSWSLLEKQFKLVTVFKAKDFNVVSAVKPCNKAKNRSLNLIPIESHRVHITPKPGTDGSDYINATFLQGYNRLREYIVTQHPLMTTMADFWQMVWDHNSQTVVVLSVVDEKEYPQFWPDTDEEQDYGSFKVKPTSDETATTASTDTVPADEKPSGGPGLVSRDFILQSTQDDYELSCRVIQCPGWPQACTPMATLFDLIRTVAARHAEDLNGPVVIVDKCGGTEAATFCCLSSLYKQLESEKCVDVYLYAKLYHMRRPGIWKSQDDFLFLYRAVESLLAVSNSPAAAAPILANATNGQLTSNGHAVKIEEVAGKIESPD